MPAWKYDSHCNDMVMEYINDNLVELEVKVQQDMMDYILFEKGELNYEFVLGVVIYSLRIGIVFSNEFLKVIRDMIDHLIENGKFNDWVDREMRIEKIKHERKIISNILNGRDLKFSKMVKKPLEFESVNDCY